MGSVMTRGVGWRLQREGIYVYIQLIHVVQQKPTQRCNYPPILKKRTDACCGAQVMSSLTVRAIQQGKN